MTYPNTDLYIIQYKPGSCGKFISTLISSLCYSREYNIKFSKHGNAHYIHSVKNYKKEPNKDFFVFNYSIQVMNELLPVVLETHASFNYSKLIEVFPKVKTIRIETSYPDDYMLMHANRYYKCNYDSFHENWWPEQIRKHEADMFLNSAETPFDENITDDMIMNLLSYRFNIGPEFEFLPEHTEPNITILPLKKIYHSKNEVLAMISQATEKEITAYQHVLYDEYLKAQEPILNFLAKYNYTI